MSKRPIAILLGCVMSLSAAGAWGASDIGKYGYQPTSNNLLNILFTNYGSWGIGYTSSAYPNFAYPAGSQYDHMVRGGIWIGAKVFCDTCPAGTPPQLVVSFGSQDQNGNSATPTSEFTPLPTKDLLEERSTLNGSKFFNRNAVSEQDLIARFRDVPGKKVGDEPHVPLNVNVTESIYSWAFSFARNFVVQHFEIRNSGPALRNVYVTHYTEMQTLNKAAYSRYPDLSSGETPYSKKLITFTPEQRLLTERYCASSTNCHYERAPVVVGVMVLGTRPDSLGTMYVPGDSASMLNARFLTHRYSGGLGQDDPAYARGDDSQKYALMTHPTEIEPQEAGVSDPSQWITVGPFPSIPTDSTITVDFAWVGGNSPDPDAALALARQAAKNAQLAFNLNYKLPTPPPSPRLYARPGDNSLELLWEGSPDSAYDATGPVGMERDFEGYRIYLGESANSLRQIAEFDLKDTTGFNVGLDSLRLPPGPPITFTHAVTAIDGSDSVAVDTMRYHYVIRGLRDGFKMFAAVTSFDTGNPRVESMESGETQNRMMVIPGPVNGQNGDLGVTVFPNPYRVEARWDAGAFAKDHYLWFANLPAKCKIRIYTIAGDLIYDADFDSATYHGANARGVYSQGRDFPIKAPTLSGSMYAWDLISRFNQAVASGLYLYSVEEVPSGRRQVGKFVIIKSDREEL
jgi:hypothetical protein